MSTQPSATLPTKSPTVLWYCRRTSWTLVISVVLLSITGWLSDETPHVGNDYKFWFDKLRWSNCADVIVLGDSRVHMGVVPEDLSRELPNVEVRNFGFSGLGYSHRYLDAAEQVVRDESEHRAIILGISPNSLRSESCTNGQFERSQQTHSARSYFKARWLGSVERRWPSFQNSALKRFLFRQDVSYATIQHPSGWVEPVELSASPESVLKTYRTRFINDPVSEDVIALVLERTQLWTAQGIRVFAFRPPTCAEMEAIEEEFGNFDEPSFVSRFEQAGGTWLSPDATLLATIDASHMNSGSAHLFSCRLVRELNRHGNARVVHDVQDGQQRR